MIRQARVGDWLVEPGPACTRMWRWGRITGLLAGGDHLIVRWYGEVSSLPGVGRRTAVPGPSAPAARAG